MHPILRMLSCACVLVMASIALSAQAPHYSNLFIFGDSYCDVGNLHSPSPYYQNRWSNGPLWVDHIAGFLGLSLSPSSAGGSDYAWDGAAVTDPSFAPSIPQQVERYLSDHGGKADPDALFVLEGGINDITKITFTDPEDMGHQIALGLVQSEQQLRQAGAQHFLISNLLDVGRLPLAQPIAGLATATAIAADRHLDRLLRDEQERGVHIVRLNLFSLVNAIANDPGHFGFTNITDPCRTNSSLCTDPDHSFFFDDAHLSEFAQSDLAVAVETLLAAEDGRDSEQSGH